MRAKSEATGPERAARRGWGQEERARQVDPKGAPAGMWPFLGVYLWGGVSLVWSWSHLQPQALYRPLNLSSLAAGLSSASSAAAALQPLLAPPVTATEGKVEKLGRAFKRQVRQLREKSGRLELVFLVDESSSVGQANFRSELRFVKKLLSDFPVVPTATRVAIVTFSSKNNVVPRVDYISPPARAPQKQHKCALLSREIPAIGYRGGGTYTKGAFQQAAVSGVGGWRLRARLLVSPPR